MCERVTPRRAFRSVPEEHIFKGKVRETEEKRCQLLQSPSSEGSCTLSSCRGTAAPTGAHFLLFFFFLERKHNGFVAAVPEPPCPQRAAMVGRGCHRPPWAPGAVPGTRGRTK